MGRRHLHHTAADLTLFVVTEEAAISMHTADGTLIGHLTWGTTTRTIGNVHVHDRYQRQGLGTEMLRRAREIEPDLSHAHPDRLSSDARAWIKGIGDQPGDVR